MNLQILLFNIFILSIGVLLTINDILSFTITKYIYIHKLLLHLLIYPSILYCIQIPLFYFGLQYSTMITLNIIWNLFSSMLVSMIGFFYYREKLNTSKMVAILLGMISLLLFAFDGVFFNIN
jgi:drug/metabolite transporter (DMT)-like permease